MARRFRGFLPVVIDVECGGFNCATDALLEIAAVTIGMDEQGLLYPQDTLFYRVEPFAGANIEPAALEFTGIKLDHPLRMAVPEQQALTDIFRSVRKAVKSAGCKRAILVGHNSSFDLGFLNAAIARCEIKRNPFHPFSSFDTATLAGLAYGQTVLAKACQAAGIDFDGREAHSARYDTEDRRAVLRDRQSLEGNGRLGRVRRLAPPDADVRGDVCRSPLHNEKGQSHDWPLSPSLRAACRDCVLADEGLHLELVWQHRAPLAALEQVGKVRRQRQRLTDTGLLHRIREFHRMRGASVTIGMLRLRRHSRAACADGGMRIEHLTGLLEHPGDGRAGLLVVHRQRIEESTRFGPAILFHREPAAGAKPSSRSATALPLRPCRSNSRRSKLDDTMMSMDGDSEGCSVSLS